MQDSLFSYAEYFAMRQKYQNTIRNNVMAIKAPKQKQGSAHPEMATLIKNLTRQLGPKKISANTRIQGALQQKANTFASDGSALTQLERQLKIRITFAGSELTVTSRS